MSPQALPDFERSVRLSQGNLKPAELSECHGILCGLICRSTIKTANDFVHHLVSLHLLVDPGPGMNALLTELFETTVIQMADEELGFVLWLPQDDESLEDQTIALGQWCSGFLAGLACGGKFDILSEEAREAIDDLQQIARAELTALEDGEEDSEEDEAALVEIIEYVRIVSLMMQEEFRGPGTDDAIH